MTNQENKSEREWPERIELVRFGKQFFLRDEVNDDLADYDALSPPYTLANPEREAKLREVVERLREDGNILLVRATAFHRRADEIEALLPERGSD